MAIAAFGLLVPVAWQQHGSIATLPLVVSYCVSVFSLFLLGIYNPKSGRSSYPKHMLMLPVRTFALVAYPMLIAAVGVSLGWAALTLALRAWNVDLPLILPAMAAVAAISWLLAFSWWPFASEGARGVVAIVVMTALILTGLWPVMLLGYPKKYFAAILPIYAVLAFFLAWKGVAIDRRGDGRKPLGLMTLVERVLLRLTFGLRRGATAERLSLGTTGGRKGSFSPPSSSGSPA